MDTVEKPSAAIDCSRVVAAAHSLVYWRNPFVSGLAFACGLLAFYLVGIQGYSAITLLAYAAMMHITVRFSYAHARAFLADLKVLEATKPVEVPDTFISEEAVASLLPAITKLINKSLAATLRLLLGECGLFHGAFNPLVPKCLAALYAVALASRLLGTTGLLFVLFLAVSTLPKVYELKRREIDALGERSHEAAGQLFNVLKQQAQLLMSKAADVRAAHAKASAAKASAAKVKKEVAKDD